ncbi:MAG: CorA family divalent cation transporter, partial [Oscillospiraceae bacterium]
SRLFTSVNDLKEYTAHVRNSYQEQVNINLNLTMKLFTVISAIFLPLSLIVGWYGMNFTMPEFGWKFGYLGVILLSITIIGVTIALFKKNKWF